MKSTLSRALACFTMVSLLSPLGFARTGPGSGNGDGDRAFALQRLSAANPSLTPSQILLKAFDESAGRVPNLAFGASKPSGILTVADGTIYEMKGITKGLEILLTTPSQKPPKEVPVNDFKFQKVSGAYGPLISNAQDQIHFMLASNGYGGEATTCNGGLCLNANKKPWVEMRLYDKKTIVFITRAFGKECYTLAQNENKAQFNDGEICSVGYYWAE